MNRDEITRKTSELSTIAHTTEDSKVEYWYARELMTYMGYDRWENFSKAITRAKQACDNSGVSVESLFRPRGPCHCREETLSVYPNHTQQNRTRAHVHAQPRRRTPARM